MKNTEAPATANHVLLIVKLLEENNAQEAMLQAIDLLDQLSTGHLQVSLRGHAPDPRKATDERREAYGDGYRAGKIAGAEEALKTLGEVKASLQGALNSLKGLK